MHLAQTPDNPLVSLWRQIGNAEWVANVGIPLGVTVMALILTVLIFVGQAWIGKKRRVIDRRREFAGQYADALRDFASELVDVVGSYTSDSRVSKLQALSDAHGRVRAAAGRATRRFSNPDDMRAGTDYVHAMVQRWNAWFDYHDELVVEHPGLDIAVPLLRVARGDATQIRRLADVFEEWDGELETTPQVAIAEVPDLKPIRVAPRRPDAAAGWRAERRRELDELIAIEMELYQRETIANEPGEVA